MGRLLWTRIHLKHRQVSRYFELILSLIFSILDILRLFHLPIYNLTSGPTGIFKPDLQMNFDSDRLSVDNSDIKYKKHKDGMGDEEINTYEERKIEAAAAHIPNWPKSVYAYLKFGYDNTFARQIWRRQKTTFKKWIDSVMTHVQTYYRHKSLPTKIQFAVIA